MKPAVYLFLEGKPFFSSFFFLRGTLSRDYIPVSILKRELRWVLVIIHLQAVRHTWPSPFQAKVCPGSQGLELD